MSGEIGAVLKIVLLEDDPNDA
ncbi:MAG: hypothetical protein RLZZ403_1319, partial [Pseudomonadota bacterium]